MFFVFFCLFLSLSFLHLVILFVFSLFFGCLSVQGLFMHLCFFQIIFYLFLVILSFFMFFVSFCLFWLFINLYVSFSLLYSMVYSLYLFWLSCVFFWSLSVFLWLLCASTQNVNFHFIQRLWSGDLRGQGAYWAQACLIICPWEQYGPSVMFLFSEGHFWQVKICIAWHSC